jgi:hypothetical protein
LQEELGHDAYEKYRGVFVDQFLAMLLLLEWSDGKFYTCRDFKRGVEEKQKEEGATILVHGRSSLNRKPRIPFIAAGASPKNK